MIHHQESNNYLLLLQGENLIISLCYFTIAFSISYSIWRNRETGIDLIVLTIAGIFFSCAVGHIFHAMEMFGFDNMTIWQTFADFATVIVAASFLSFYRSFSLLTRFSQIVASETDLQIQNQTIKDTLEKLKLTQTQMIQSEKMSSLGQLVAGVAHEINNPVNFIHANLIYVEQYTQELLDLVELYQRNHTNNNSEIQEFLESVEVDFIQEDLPNTIKSMKVGTQRIREIVLSLRTFSRMDEAEFKEINIHESIDSTLLILQHRLKDKPEHPGINIIKDYEQLPLIECYAGQLNQVFMNILTNAIDAIEEKNSKLKFAEIAANPKQITIRTLVIDNDWIEIAIADNGIGIPETIQQQIFNPFFTTKPVGKGTGMGMSISYQIITEKHGGKLECFSIPNQGTEFVIKIPIRQ
ncbi:sensor histidine kinase [Calothrix sp. UHCC 0171]|uniref:sensor histidine kinase n=1 Tax=Calothrix sp. UHCC 0171 TaxID=3110245 RepID=UPI002B205462|nr:ATP-binding protein [Calothrix sp. UHCC 0171]MEA5574476.1 ATP-binding protein [Calothrix sp. UHCC 0171]